MTCQKNEEAKLIDFVEEVKMAKTGHNREIWEVRTVTNTVLC